MDSNSSLDWPQALNYNGTYKYLYMEGNVSYVNFYLHQPSVAAVFITSYLLIFLLCMVGNGGVCFIVLWSKHMRTVTNLFILNLAVSDLLVGLFCMPTTLLDNIIAGGPGRSRDGESRRHVSEGLCGHSESLQSEVRSSGRCPCPRHGVPGHGWNSMVVRSSNPNHSMSL